ncbi:hypothetical protein C8R44DRAFT_755157 [Mycena epipterygia]|nr:hypothetical protein C8R44DRAFT_755157 [Mycena epipterygia]
MSTPRGRFKGKAFETDQMEEGRTHSREVAKEKAGKHRRSDHIGSCRISHSSFAGGCRRQRGNVYVCDGFAIMHSCLRAFQIICCLTSAPAAFAVLYLRRRYCKAILL